MLPKQLMADREGEGGGYLRVVLGDQDYVVHAQALGCLRVRDDLHHQEPVFLQTRERFKRLQGDVCIEGVEPVDNEVMT